MFYITQIKHFFTKKWITNFENSKTIPNKSNNKESCNKWRKEHCNTDTIDSRTSLQSDTFQESLMSC